jgi:hypothetical protein
MVTSFPAAATAASTVATTRLARSSLAWRRARSAVLVRPSERAAYALGLNWTSEPLGASWET